MIFKRENTASTCCVSGINHRTIVLRSYLIGNKITVGVACATSKFPCRLKDDSPLWRFLWGDGRDFRKPIDKDVQIC
jgi:hypothetical protein